MTEKSEKTKAQAQTIGLMEETMRTYEQSIRTGLKMQEEASKWWINMFNQTAASQDWQRRVTRIVEEWIPVAQEGLDESMKMMEQNARVGMDLMKRTVEAVQCSAIPRESQIRWMDLWECSAKTLRSNAQSMNAVNEKAFGSFISFVRKSSEMLEPKTGKAV